MILFNKVWSEQVRNTMLKVCLKNFVNVVIPNL